VTQKSFLVIQICAQTAKLGYFKMNTVHY